MGLFMTVIMTKKGQVIDAFHPNVQKHIELKFVLNKMDSEDDSNAKEHVFPAKECLA